MQWITVKTKLSIGDGVSAHVLRVWWHKSKLFWLESCAIEWNSKMTIKGARSQSDPQLAIFVLTICNFVSFRQVKWMKLLNQPFSFNVHLFQEQLCQKSMINVKILSINSFAAAAKVCIDSHIYDFYPSSSSSSSSSACSLSSWQFFFSLPS